MKKLSEEKLSFWDKRLQRKMIQRLRTVDKREWQEIGHQMNGWEIPTRFYDLIPRWWHKKPHKWFAFIHPIIQVIELEFGRKEGLRFHNVHRGKMTNAEFEYWFYNVHKNRLSPEDDDTVVQYYDRSAFMDQVEWWKTDVFEKIKNALESEA